MKVIFLENIEGNKVGETKEVSDGYARNYLLKKGLAVQATQSELQNLEKKLSKLQKEEEEKVKKAEELASKLGALKLEMSAEASPEDTEGKRKLFGSVTNSNIEELLQKEGFEVDKKDIELGEQIRELGEYEVTIKLGHGVSTKIPLVVSAK